MTKVLAVNISEKKGEIKHQIEKGYFEVNNGLVGDIHAGNGHRQVSLLGQETIDQMDAMGVEGFCTVKFIGNLTTQGIKLSNLQVGSKLKIGGTILEITQIGKECYLDCPIKAQADDCLMPKESIFARVIVAGWIKPEDRIEII
ncbi:MAG: hypothetical protein K0R09_1362 [Clostridiales bacterium]|jgi:MOSC domain-containing protein YiiM|nr:hypothetical protein [Clostridiales bacterium]